MTPHPSTCLRNATRCMHAHMRARRSPGAKYEQAIEMTEEAANIFKINKQWDRAADAFMLQAEYQNVSER